MLQSVSSAARILIVDDERSYRIYFASCLRSRGHTIYTSACASDALSVWEAVGGCELVVTDLHMPGMDGLQLRDELQRRRPGLRVLVLSATGSSRLGVLRKPETYQRLFAVVDAALALQPRPDGSGSGPTVRSDDPLR